MKTSVLRLLYNDEGAALVEYGMIIALLAIVTISALQYLGSKANNTLFNAANSLS